MPHITTAPISEMPAGGECLRFEHSDSPNLQVTRMDYNRCEWHNVRMKGASFEEATITRSRFVDCYLRRATFTRVDLTGTKFLRCDLSHTHFDDSKLWYVEFFDCEVDYQNLIENLPPEVNLRRRLLHSLRRNALVRGETRIGSRLLILEMGAWRLEDKNIFLAATSYFRDNFSFADRVYAFGRWLLHGFESLIWGYGERISILFRTALIVITAAATTSWAGGARYATVSGERPLSFLESLYISAATFSTIGDWSPASPLAQSLRILLSLSGAVFLGLLAAAAFKRIGR